MPIRVSVCEAAFAALALGACASPQRVAPSIAHPAPALPPAGMQYLYGSGEGAAASMQAWRMLVGYVRDQMTLQFRAPGTRRSVVLEPGSTLANPAFQRCGFKPLAAVFDVDETALLNLGFEADDAAHPGVAYDPKRWEAWERTGADKVSASPGAVEALGALRAMNVAVIFNSNRLAANAAATEAAIDGAGLGPARHGDTLYLSGDDRTGSAKDGRRAMIAERYCVVAMAGDQLGDFSDLFNGASTPVERRAAAMSGGLAAMWGEGWFILPNPVYGTALKGGIDDVFPIDKRWTPPMPKEKK